MAARLQEMERTTEEFVSRRQTVSRISSRVSEIDVVRTELPPFSGWLTPLNPCVRYARMLRSVVFASERDPRAPRIARRVGVAIALAATLGQLLVAAHSESSLRIVAHAAAAHEIAVATLSVPTGHATPHDSADCPTCRAAAHARTAVRSASLGRATASFPRLELACFDTVDLPGPRARSTVAPRAPPA